MKKQKTIMVWALIPNDFEYTTQYFSTEDEAKNEAQKIPGGASVCYMEMLKRVVDRKGMSMAMGKYKV